MMEVIEDLPADVVGIAARGKIVKEDYENLIIPVIEQRIAEHGKIKMLFELHHFDGMELAAMSAAMSLPLRVGHICRKNAFLYRMRIVVSIYRLSVFPKYFYFVFDNFYPCSISYNIDS